VVIVPNIVGQTLGDAQTQLAKAASTERSSPEFPRLSRSGPWSPNILPGETHIKGSNVELNVSRGAR
jgi:hypothetical protein